MNTSIIFVYKTYKPIGKLDPYFTKFGKVEKIYLQIYVFKKYISYNKSCINGNLKQNLISLIF
jgi:hypothetical protein